MEALLYVLAAVGLVAVAYFFGGRKYAAAAGTAVMGVLYFVFGNQDDWTDAWKDQDKKKKKEEEKLKEEQKEKEKGREQTDDEIKESKERTDELKDDLEDVVENTPKPGDAEDLKDWVESFK
jgi:septal ring factor EnvC (AmiA/AmiB activator)